MFTVGTFLVGFSVGGMLYRKDWLNAGLAAAGMIILLLSR
jgi:hypothetical protein